MKLPVLEDLASIPIAVARISEALIANRIDVKQSAQLSWGLKLPYQAISGRDDELPGSVMSVTRTEQGDELASELILCAPGDKCRRCKYRKTCSNLGKGPGLEDEEDDIAVNDDDGDDGEAGSDDEAEAGAGGGDEDDAVEEEDTGDAVDENAEAGDDADDATEIKRDGDNAGFTVEDIENHKDYIAAREYLDSVCRIAGIDPP
ncbi:MAG: hypothetical protein ABSF23_04220 [Terracidiphilus sp.]